MELHQIRYFLALEKTLNFTRAAENCNVSQPALSRSISQLEAELGGELFRRERNLTHLTDFGHTLKLELQKCYEASLNAKELAREFLKDGHAPLNIVLARTVEMATLLPQLTELTKAFPRLEIKMTRNPPHEIGEMLKSGNVEIAISGPLGDGWERLQTRKLYEEEFGLLISQQHKLSGRNGIELADLDGERLLSRPYCSLSDLIVSKLKELGARNISKLEVPAVDDLPGLVQSQFGIGLWPTNRKLNGEFLVSRIHGVDISRWIHVHTVFGRRLSPGASALVNLLRARDWSVLMPSQVTPSQPATAEVLH